MPFNIFYFQFFYHPMLYYYIIYILYMPEPSESFVFVVLLLSITDCLNMSPINGIDDEVLKKLTRKLNNCIPIPPSVGQSFFYRIPWGGTIKVFFDGASWDIELINNILDSPSTLGDLQRQILSLKNQSLNDPVSSTNNQLQWATPISSIFQII
jgi:hypothetical protein